MRHPKEGAPFVAAKAATVPIINAGDGGHFHPTQTLTDLLTIKRKKGSLNNLTIGLCGDLKFGRTVHSLIAAMSRYTGIKFVLISPEELKLPGYVKYEFLGDGKIAYEEVTDMSAAMPELDILYMTRIQQERFASHDEYLRLKDSYILTVDTLVNAKPDLCIMHPLPRVNEISVKVDEDPRACYFEQAKNGRYIRMALILKLLSETDKPDTVRPGEITEDIVCSNPKCITSTEQELPQMFRCVDEEHGIHRCAYCDQKAYPKKRK